MEFLFNYQPQLLLLTVILIGLTTWFWWDEIRGIFYPPEEETPRLNHAAEATESTRQMPDINPGMDIPQEDQQYLQPIVVEVLKKLAFSKKMFPTNAMLIEHLSEALAHAANSFEPRKSTGDPPETGNEQWLFVAAFAIRLYSEGSAHNCKQALDAFVTDGHLSERRLKQWATRINNEISQRSRQETVGTEGVQDVTQHAQTVGGTGYTQDEIDDMKSAANEGQSGTDSAFGQALKDNDK